VTVLYLTIVHKHNYQCRRHTQDIFFELGGSHIKTLLANRTTSKTPRCFRISGFRYAKVTMEDPKSEGCRSRSIYRSSEITLTSYQPIPLHQINPTNSLQPSSTYTLNPQAGILPFFTNQIVPAAVALTVIVRIIPAFIKNPCSKKPAN
jgi:hypothetical protein